MTIPKGRRFEYAPSQLPFVVGEDAYWVDAGKRVIEVPRVEGKQPTTIDLGDWMSPFALHGDELLLISEKAIFALATTGGKPTRRFELDDETDPVVVGDRLVLRSRGVDGKGTQLHHAPVGGGEFTTLDLGGTVNSNTQPVVRADAMLLVLDWGKIVRVAGDLGKVETVYELGPDQPNAFIVDATFVGDSIVFVLGEVRDEPKLALVRQAPDATRTTLQEVPNEHRTSLVGDGERAVWQIQDSGAWLVDAATIQAVDLGGWTTRIAGTPAGLMWQVGDEVRIASSEPPRTIDYPNAAVEADERGPKPRGPSVEGKSAVIGPLDPDHVRRIARAHINGVRKCSKPTPKLDASVALAFTIGAEGKVGDVVARDAESFPDQAVLGCLIDEVATWVFPKPGHGGVAKVVHTIEFEPG